MAWFHKFALGALQGVAQTLPGALQQREQRQARDEAREARQRDVAFREERAGVADYNTALGGAETSVRAAVSSGDPQGAATLLEGLTTLKDPDRLRLQAEIDTGRSGGLRTAVDKGLDAVGLIDVALGIAKTPEELRAASSNLVAIQRAEREATRLGGDVTPFAGVSDRYNARLAELEQEKEQRTAAQQLVELYRMAPEKAVGVTRSQELISAYAKALDITPEAAAPLARMIGLVGVDQKRDRELTMALNMSRIGKPGMEAAADLFRDSNPAMADMFALAAGEESADEFLSGAQRAIALQDYATAATMFEQAGEKELAGAARRADQVKLQTLTPAALLRERAGLIADWQARIIRANQDGEPLTLGGKAIKLEDVVGMVNETLAPLLPYVQTGSLDGEPFTLPGAAAAGGNAVAQVLAGLEKIWEADWTAEEVISALDGGFAQAEIGRDLSPEDRKAVLDGLRLAHPEAFGSAAARGAPAPAAVASPPTPTAGSRGGGRGGFRAATSGGVDLSGLGNTVAKGAAAVGRGLLDMNPALAVAQREMRNQSRQAKVSSRTIKALGGSEEKVK